MTLVPEMGEPMTDETLCGICNKGYRSPFKWIVNGGNIYHDNCLFAEITRLTAERDAAYTDIQEQREYINRLEHLLNIAATERNRLRADLQAIAGFGSVNLAGEWDGGLRDIIRSMTDRARDALEQTAQTEGK